MVIQCFSNADYSSQVPSSFKKKKKIKLWTKGAKWWIILYMFILICKWLLALTDRTIVKISLRASIAASAEMTQLKSEPAG